MIKPENFKQSFDAGIDFHCFCFYAKGMNSKFTDINENKNWSQITCRFGGLTTLLGIGYGWTKLTTLEELP